MSTKVLKDEKHRGKAKRLGKRVIRPLAFLLVGILATFLQAQVALAALKLAGEKEPERRLCKPEYEVNLGTYWLSHYPLVNQTVTIHIDPARIQNSGEGCEQTALKMFLPLPDNSWWWRIIERPEGSTSTLSEVDVMNPSLLLDREGTYKVRFTACDPHCSIKVGQSDFEVPKFSQDIVFAASRVLPPETAPILPPFSSNMTLVPTAPTPFFIDQLMTKCNGGRGGTDPEWVTVWPCSPGEDGCVPFDSKVQLSLGVVADDGKSNGWSCLKSAFLGPLALLSDVTCAAVVGGVVGAIFLPAGLYIAEKVCGGGPLERAFWRNWDVCLGNTLTCPLEDCLAGRTRSGCFETAICERQSGGECAFSMTDELTRCLQREQQDCGRKDCLDTACSSDRSWCNPRQLDCFNVAEDCERQEDRTCAFRQTEELEMCLDQSQ